MHNQVTIHSEVDIRQLLAAGDPVAFGKLYEQNRRKLYKAAYAILKSSEDTLEVIQEIFLHAWLARARFENVKCLEAYLYIMARNKAISLLLKRKREVAFLLNEWWECGISPSPHYLVEEQEYDALYEYMLERLTDRQRAVFKMTREENMTHDAIAKHFDISPHTVNNHIKAALTTIRNVLAIQETDRKPKRADRSASPNAANRTYGDSHTALQRVYSRNSFSSPSIDHDKNDLT
jgi:RNA polymerase sigma-70 factor (ECF subfamily)